MTAADDLAGDVPERFRAPLMACAEGRTAPIMALTALLMESEEPRQVAAALAAVLAQASGEGAARLAAMQQLLDAHPDAHRQVRAVLAAVDHASDAGSDDVQRIAAMFDRAAEAAPEASVALYSLGDSARLQASSDEIVRWLGERRLIGRTARVLDLGCGIGRMLAALAPHVAQVTGVDVSTVMVRIARERTLGLPNVTVLATSGRDLAAFADGSFDLVLAVDSFPYLFQAGAAVTATHVHEAARVLCSSGRLTILNASYRDDIEADRRDLRRMGSGASLSMIVEGERPFRLWDGAAFVLAR